ncbi:hypothetical protein [Oceanospirillum beijerinckii]|uniref:hypothetical protein n=1 Tax=Oceanospirillum beijerinckii TaxID=64976 RepID=UPI000410166A|nr:hypothetical protein [Oceanospirillum beijerinckii]
MPDDYEKLHPILNAMTETLTGLYEHKKDEEIRQKLIKLEGLLHDNLEKIQDAKKE